MRDGNRQRRRVNGATKREVQERLDEILNELRAGAIAPADYTVEQTVEDWLDSQGNLTPKTIKTKRELLAPILAEIAAKQARTASAQVAPHGARTATTSGRTSC